METRKGGSNEEGIAVWGLRRYLQQREGVMVRLTVFSVLMLSLLLLNEPADAGLTLSGSVVCTGAGEGTTGDVGILSAVGQAAVGRMTGDTYSTEAGFWRQQACLKAGVDNPVNHPITRCWFGQNHPNPFRATTTIRFSVPCRSHVSVNLYDVTGRHVRTILDGQVDPGHHLLDFDGEGLAGGVYFCRMVSGRFVQSRKMILLN
jgi:hypothetical protein